jgi:prepilin-type N-terminal cleavage/methylation domain-containing protein
LKPLLGAIDCHEVVMKNISRNAFTLLELMITVAVIGILSSLVIRSTYTFLQEQKLRQAANEFVSYLLTARARALREANVVPVKACEVFLEVPSNASPTTVKLKPTNHLLNVCSDIPELDLRATAGGSDLSMESLRWDQGSSTHVGLDSSYPITFTHLGTVASRSLSDQDTALDVGLPRIYYFSNSATQLRRCVMVDLNSLRFGWRNSKPSTNDALCKYDGN